MRCLVGVSVQVKHRNDEMVQRQNQECIAEQLVQCNCTEELEKGEEESEEAEGGWKVVAAAGGAITFWVIVALVFHFMPNSRRMYQRSSKHDL